MAVKILRPVNRYAVLNNPNAFLYPMEPGFSISSTRVAIAQTTNVAAIIESVKNGPARKFHRCSLSIALHLIFLHISDHALSCAVKET
jgi:hypothetical protein